MTKTKAKPTAKSAPRKAKAKAVPKAAKAKAKAKPAPKLPIEWRVLRAAFDLIEDAGWSNFELDDLVNYARIDPEDLFLLVESKSDLLILLGEQIDQAMLDGGEAEGSVRDSLFDLMMRRFDALQPWRAGVQAVVDDLTDDPMLPLHLARPFHSSMTLVLEAAGLSPTPLRVLGLSTVALATFKDWLSDDSDDLSFTMAALDRRLARLEELASLFGSVGA